MSEDINLKIGQLKDMLNKPDLQDSLKSIMQLIPNQQTEHLGTQTSSFFSNENEIMIQKLQKILSKKNQLNDPRVNLLNAIKPYLNQKRQKKIDSYSKILDITLLSQIFKDI